MKTKPTLILASLLTVLATPSWAAPGVHSVWSTRPLYLADATTTVPTWYSPTVGNSVSSWKVAFTNANFSHVYAEVGSNKYEFRLVATTLTIASEIDGLWNIYKNGVLVCNNCIGKAYGLDQPIGNYFKIYVGTPAAYAEKWHYSGYITNRFDY